MPEQNLYLSEAEKQLLRKLSDATGFNQNAMVRECIRTAAPIIQKRLETKAKGLAVSLSMMLLCNLILVSMTLAYTVY